MVEKTFFTGPAEPEHFGVNTGSQFEIPELSRLSDALLRAQGRSVSGAPAKINEVPGRAAVFGPQPVS
jgi:hypothetical protein